MFTLRAKGESTITGCFIMKFRRSIVEVRDFPLTPLFAVGLHWPKSPGYSFDISQPSYTHL